MNDHRHSCPDGSRVTASRHPAARDVGDCAHNRQAVRWLGPDQSGSILLLVAFCLMVLIAVTALALDLANLFLTASLNQRIADQAALAAAFAYSQSGNSLATATTAASSMAVANGAGSATVSTSIVTSPSGDGNNAARVVVTSTVPLSPFGKAISAVGVVSVNAGKTAYAEIQNGTPCIIALATSGGGGTGISATNGSPVTATGCEVASNYNVSTSSGGSVTASSIYAVGTISGTTTGSKHASAAAQTDPFASAGVFSRMSTVSALTAPSFPSVGSAPSGGSAMSCTTTLTVPSGTHSTLTGGSGCTTITFSGGAETDISGSGITLTGSTTTMNFAAGTYKINGINISSSANVTINTTGTVVFDIFTNGFTVTGCSKLTVNGPATYNIQGGLWDNNIATCTSHPVVFNNSNGGTSTFNVAGGGNENALTVTGNSATFPDGTYALSAETSCSGSCLGLSIGSNAVATFGNGSYVIAGHDGGITVGTSGNLTIGSGANGSSVFQITGIAYTYDNAIYTASSSTLTLGGFTNFDLNGGFTLSSSASFGAGIYTVNGPFSACASGGSVSGTGVSIIASGTVCFGAGFNSVSLSAPTAISDTTVGTTPTIVIASDSTTAATVTAGATSTVLVGTLYLPDAALTVNGGGNLNGGGNCLEVIASSLTFTSDANGVSTSCASSSAASISIVQ